MKIDHGHAEDYRDDVCRIRTRALSALLRLARTLDAWREELLGAVLSAVTAPAGTANCRFATLRLLLSPPVAGDVTCSCGSISSRPPETRPA